MDLFTHIVVGAATGEMAFGKKLGNRAPIAGAVVSLLPDMDILFTPFFDEITSLGFHRGITHSLFFMAVVSPVLGMLFNKWFAAGTKTAWSLLSLLALAGHVLLDVMTNYGTQLFQPFSPLQVSLGSISVIDPAFTVPVLAGFLTGRRLQRSNSKRLFFNGLGLLLGGCYLVFTIFNKWHVQSIFEQALQRQQIGYERLALVPESAGNLYWHAVAQNPKGWYVGDYSLLDETKDIEFYHFNGDPGLLQQFRDQRAVERLKWYSKGVYLARREGRHIRMYHVKCHLTAGYEQGEVAPSAGYFELSETPDGRLQVHSVMLMSDEKTMNLYRAKWKRIMGK